MVDCFFLQLGNRGGRVNVLVHGLDLLLEVLSDLWAAHLECGGHHAVIHRERISSQVHTLRELESTECAGLTGLLELFDARGVDLGLGAQLGESLEIAHSDLGAGNGIGKGQEGLRLGDNHGDKGALERVAADKDLLNQVAAGSQDVLDLFGCNVFTLGQLLITREQKNRRGKSH